ncbi:MAG: UDP-N-acetylglucosamine 2-epimerase [Nitrososphaerota archaeon]|nr:UDP-N-acetylglucosamine 2-epimerase [Nitrososphaerota archaeon]
MVVNTGQHKDFEMAQQFVQELRLPTPVANLGSSPLQLPIVTRKLEEEYVRRHVSEVFVIGDTDTALAGALAAHSTRTPLTHIEAGLRCNEPIPEEYNRRLVDTLADLLLAPEEYAAENLDREHVLGRVTRSPNYKVLLFKKYISNIAPKLRRKKQRFSLMSLHRQENVDNRNRLERILKYLGNMQSAVLWPIHPRARIRIREFGLRLPDNIEVCAPLSYHDMVSRLIEAKAVFSDSGGLVLEAFELGKQLVIFRKSIEWKHVWDAPTTSSF